MESDYLILRRASAFRPTGEWNDDDYDVLCNGVVVGRIMQAAAVPVGMSWMWTLAFEHHEDRTPAHGYAATREAALVACAKSWRRENDVSARKPRGVRRVGRAAINRAETTPVPPSRRPPSQRGWRSYQEDYQCAPVLGLRSF